MQPDLDPSPSPVQKKNKEWKKMYQMHPKKSTFYLMLVELQIILFSYFCFSKFSRCLTLNLYILISGGSRYF